LWVEALRIGRSPNRNEFGRDGAEERVDIPLELQQWWRDNEGWTQWQPPGWGLGGRVRRVTQDATAHLTVAGLAGGGGDGPALGAVLIEVDLATMTQQRLGYKLARYRDYAADQAWRGAHPHCPVLPVLTTTPGTGRDVPTRRRETLLSAPLSHRRHPGTGSDS
jgi:hypothetical protein